MTASAAFKIVGSVVICSLALISAVLWRDWPSDVASCLPVVPSHDDQPVLLQDCVHSMSGLVMAVKWALGLSALIALAIVVSRLVASRPRLMAAIACAASAFIAIIGLSIVSSTARDEVLLPSSMAVLIVCGASGLLGALVSVGTVLWWPNPSLERP
jgi:hypothetical protein